MRAAALTGISIAKVWHKNIPEMRECVGARAMPQYWRHVAVKMSKFFLLRINSPMSSSRLSLLEAILH